MPCLSPIQILHPTLKKSPYEFQVKYLSLQPNTPRTLFVPCGKCSFCRRKRANDWKIRLQHESLSYPPFGIIQYRKGYRPRHGATSYIDPNHNARIYFGTLTFDDRNVYCAEKNPARYVRLFLERYRKVVKKSVRHWIATDVGEDNHRFHFHFVFFDLDYRFLRPLPKGETFELYNYTVDSSDPAGELVKLWSYGKVFIEPLESLKGLSYITKYMLKPPAFDTDFIPRLFVSPGLGSDWIMSQSDRLVSSNIRFLTFRNSNTGTVVHYSLPRYYYCKMYDEYERRIRYLDSLELYEPKRIGKNIVSDYEYFTYYLALSQREGLKSDYWKYQLLLLKH